MSTGVGQKVLKPIAAALPWLRFAVLWRLGWVLRYLSRERHFAIAVAILLGVAVTVAMLGWVVKYPVPWPENVEVDKNFRMLSLPDRLGPYSKILKDGVVYDEADGQPDGERIFSSKEMRPLGLGTSYDRARRPGRRSNWYVSRIYEDNRISDLQDPYKLWQLEVYYYTGLKDKVPHVPERCGQAGGATLKSSKRVAFSAPTARPPWDEVVHFQRAHFERGKPGQIPRQIVEYYVFSLNGKPQRLWELVRVGMGLPLSCHNYFAKIQFAPIGRGTIASVDEADTAAAEFIKYALPSIIQTLPSKADIEKLGKAEEKKGG